LVENLIDMEHPIKAVMLGVGLMIGFGVFVVGIRWVFGKLPGLSDFWFFGLTFAGLGTVAYVAREPRIMSMFLFMMVWRWWETKDRPM